MFYKLGCSYMRHKLKNSKIVGIRRFKSFFGITPEVCSVTWNLLDENMGNGYQPKHLLWCLHFLKQYQVDHVNRSIFKADEKTVSKWVWIFIELLAELNVVMEIDLIISTISLKIYNQLINSLINFISKYFNIFYI